ncbi:hypothetical protein EON63_21985 [archaeon]|nr:MAG: hypothetical protein EON63_21985 [archaeon]
MLCIHSVYQGVQHSLYTKHHAPYIIHHALGYIEKSSSSLRLAYLRQDIIDTLNTSLTLHEELLTAFAEENAILKKITEAEDRYGYRHGHGMEMDMGMLIYHYYLLILNALGPSIGSPRLPMILTNWSRHSMT